VSGASLPDLVGFAGVGLIVATYFLSQIGRMRTTAPLYPAINGAGALLILYSLYHRPNPPSIVIEVFWLIISIIGLARALMKSRSG
jgi:hypothetical protein